MSAAADAFRIAAEFVGVGTRVSSEAVKITRHYGMLVRTAVRANASGRPGPRAITGRYRRSINLQMQVKGGDVEASVGTNAPQGPRLELGFVGRDSLNRYYNQPPFPHFGPAIDKYEKPYADAIASKVIL